MTTCDLGCHAPGPLTVRVTAWHRQANPFTRPRTGRGKPIRWVATNSSKLWAIGDAQQPAMRACAHERGGTTMRDQQLRAPRRRSVILRGLNRRLPQEPANPPVSGWEPRYRRYVITSDVLVTLLTSIGVGGLISVGGAALFKDLTLGFLTVITLKIGRASWR